MARRDYTRDLEIKYDKLFKKYKKQFKVVKKLMSDTNGTNGDEKTTPTINPSWWERLGSLISKIKTKEMRFDKAYVAEIKGSGASETGNIKQYQRIVLFITITNSVKFIFLTWQAFLYLNRRGI